MSLKLITTILLIILVFTITGCISDDNKERLEAYNKCTTVCAAVLEDDFVTMKLCNDECQKEFLNNTA